MNSIVLVSLSLFAQSFPVHVVYTQLQTGEAAHPSAAEQGLWPQTTYDRHPAILLSRFVALSSSHDLFLLSLSIHRQDGKTGMYKGLVSKLNEITHVKQYTW